MTTSLRALRRVGSVLVVLAAARVLSVALQAATLALQARALGVAGFGTHATVAALAYLSMTACDFGLSSRALRLGAEEDPRIARDLARLRLITLLFLGVVVASCALALQHRSRGVDIAIATGAFVAGEIASELAVSIHLGERSRVDAAIWMVARRVGGLAPFLVLGINTDAAIVGLGLSGVLGVLPCALVAARRSGSGTKALSLIRDCLAFWATSLVASVQRLDVLIVGALGGTHLAGLYGASSRLSNPLNTVTSLLFQFAIPEISSAPTDDEKRRRFVLLRRVICLYAAVLALSAFFCVPITVLLLGEQYRSASIITAGVIVGAAFSAVAQTQTAWYLATAMPSGVGRRTLMGSIVGLALLSVLTLAFGTEGAAAGTAAFGVTVLISVLPRWVKEDPHHATMKNSERVSAGSIERRSGS